jgi:hypothetical protein
VVTAVTGGWSYVLLDRSATFLPWLRYVVVAAGLLAAVGLLVADRVGRAVVAGVLAVATVAGLGGPAAYALDTAGTPHTGSIPSAGPAVAGGMGGPGGFRPGAGGGRRFGGPPGGFGGPGGFGRFGGVRGGPGGAGGLLDAASVGSQVAAALEEDASSYTWVAAAVGANDAAGYQLATQLPVMPLGGFNGSDPSPTLAQFRADVAAGKIHWFIGSGGVGRMASTGGSQAAQSIASWVAAHYTARTVGGVTMYDLTQPAS